MTRQKVAVIGGGAAGIAAATLLAVKSPELEIHLFERDSELGGILLQCLHTGFGLQYFGRELSGPEYAAAALDNLPQDRIATHLDTHVTGISKSGVLNVSSPRKQELLTTDRVILASGSREVPFGALMIPSQRPAGIFSAGEAQFLINRQGLQPGRRAVILGAGDIGLIMCRRLLFEGIEVAAVVERAAVPGGVTRNVQTCVYDFQIPLLTSSTIVAVHGRGQIQAVSVTPVDSAGNPDFSTIQEIPCDLLLIAVGLIPEVDLALDVGAQQSRQGNGVDFLDSGRTSIPWLYVCGNAAKIFPIVDDVSRQGELVAEAVIADLEKCHD